MGRDLKNQAAVASRVDELVSWRPPQRKSAEDERPSVVGHLLAAIVSLLAHKLYGFNSLKPPFRDAQAGQGGLEWVERERAVGESCRCPVQMTSFWYRSKTVPKV